MSLWISSVSFMKDNTLKVTKMSLPQVWIFCNLMAATQIIMIYSTTNGSYKSINMKSSWCFTG